jgi:hypothetical protein
MRKGQVEFVAIIAILIIGAVVILTTYGTTILHPPPGGATELQESVKQSVLLFLREGAFEAVKKLEANGGFLPEQRKTVTFNSNPVNYWSVNGRENTPDLQSNFITLLEEYIGRNKNMLQQTLSEKNVTFGDASVSANILGSKIITTLSMPTTVKGYPIQQPYRTEIQTNLGQIFGFAENLVKSNKDERYFEYFTLSEIALSPIENGIHTTPMHVMLTRCGQSYHKDWYDLKPKMEDVITSAIEHTYMPGKVPDEIKNSKINKYTMTELGGNRYKSLNVEFHLPDNFELGRNTFTMSPGIISAEAERIVAGICLSEPVSVKYSLVYPVVVEAEDFFTGNRFYFAIEVSIIDNKPAETSGIKPSKPSLQNLICRNPQCRASLTVKSDGIPISDAMVSFMGCSLGRTDISGRLSSHSPCGAGLLEVHKSGFESYSEMKNNDELQNLALGLKKLLNVQLYFYEVTVAETGGKYIIHKNSVKPKDAKTITLRLTPLSNPEGTIEYSTTNTVDTVLLPEGEYSIGGELTYTETAYGGFLTLHSIDSETKELHIYIPKIADFNSLRSLDMLSKLTLVLNKCGLGPVSEHKITPYEDCEVAS